MVLLCGSSIMTICRYQTNKAIHQLFNPSPCELTNHKDLDHTSFINTSCNAKKFAMLSAWQTTNERISTIMDYTTGSKAICIDTGASTCISNDKRDFVTLTTVTDQTISGIGSGLAVQGRSTLLWTISDNDGNKIKLYIADALYVPNIPICLLCPQQVAKQARIHKMVF
jgi:hypothetical protein